MLEMFIAKNVAVLFSELSCAFIVKPTEIVARQARIFRMARSKKILNAINYMNLRSICLW